MLHRVCVCAVASMYHIRVSSLQSAVVVVCLFLSVLWGFTGLGMTVGAATAAVMAVRRKLRQSAPSSYLPVTHYGQPLSVVDLELQPAAHQFGLSEEEINRSREANPFSEEELNLEEIERELYQLEHDVESFD